MHNQMSHSVGSGKRTIASHRPASSKGKESAAAESSSDRVRILQLTVCAVLFLLVIIGNGVCPEKMGKIREQIRTITTENVDFRQAFSELGAAMSEVGSVIPVFQEFCVQVFMPAKEWKEETQRDVSISSSPPEMAPVLTSEIRYLSSSGEGNTILANHFLYPDGLKDGLPVLERNALVEPREEGEIDAVPVVGTVLRNAEYEGKALPANYTMNHLSLGELETVTPLMGNLNSEYGYRDHPINGKYLFHGGVDIGGQNGDPILAFASGTVAYVGENSSYGLYLQLDHGNGIKSFYAHCKRICVKKGQGVTVGEKIAEVGSSGSATGPHLHLELKCNGIHVDPAYYLDFLNV